MKALFSCVLVFIFLGACASLRRKPGTGKYSDHTITSAGLERSYTLYEPLGGDARFLLVLLHGGGGKAAGMIRLAKDMPALADKHHIRLIYPNGVGGHWNDGRGDISEAAKNHVDDVDFLRSLIALYRGEIRTVFVAGMSNGGMMAQRVACDLSDAVTGVVSVAANLPVELAQNCKPARPVLVAFINGLEDSIVPYHGGAIKILRKERGIVLSTEESLAFWQKFNRCTALPDKQMTENSLRRFYECREGSLQLITVKNGGHAWPGGSPYLPEFAVGHTSAEFSASEKILELMNIHN